MRKLTFLLTSLAVFFCAGMAHAESPKLPSRDAAVVLPLLKQFSSKDDYGRITQILGKEDSDMGGAGHDYIFHLEVSPNEYIPDIVVRTPLEGNRVLSIQHGLDVLYRAPK